jgi:hypothetical protein
LIFPKIYSARQAVNAERELMQQRIRDRGLNNNNNNNVAGRGRALNIENAAIGNMAGRDDRVRDGNATRNAYNAPNNPTKRKAPSYGKESVETWASTEVS